MNTIMVPSCFFTLHGVQACWMAYEMARRDPFQRAVPCWHPHSFIHVTISYYNMDAGQAAAWSRLQRVSCYHAAKLYIEKRGFKRLTARLKPISVPDTIKENVEILGRGDESEMKNRLFWYVTYYPEVFKNS